MSSSTSMQSLCIRQNSVVAQGTVRKAQRESASEVHRACDLFDRNVGIRCFFEWWPPNAWLETGAWCGAFVALHNVRSLRDASIIRTDVTALIVVVHVKPLAEQDQRASHKESILS